MAISGTMPAPPAISRTSRGSSGCQTNQPPTGPRSSTRVTGGQHIGQVRRHFAVVCTCFRKVVHQEMTPLRARPNPS